MRTVCGAVLALYALVFAAACALAHSAPGALLLLDARPDRITADIRIPLSELELAFGQPLSARPGQAVAVNEAALRQYLLEHVRVIAGDGRAWTVRLGSMRADIGQQPVDLIVESEWIPPPGASPRRFTLRYDAVAHEVPNHIAVVSLRRDWESGMLAASGESAEPGKSARVLGTIRFNHHAIPVDLGPGSAWAGLRASVVSGMAHIAEGTDHLLFLLVLLLPAPLVADTARRRWGGYGGARHGLVRLLQIVTAFTIGHSLTLALGALGWARPPSAPVEIVIALSILVSALHAWRPLFAGREMLIAAGFGLVHGMAFSGVVADMGLSGGWLAQAVLGFNLGIELMQIAIVAVVFPLLLLMARTPRYAAVRVPLAAFAAVAAAAWLLERMSGTENALARWLEALPEHPLAVFAALLATTAVVTRLGRSS
ncbi:MAG: HupE/UreJ family protein [Burkholderiaceae bacterium]